MGIDNLLSRREFFERLFSATVFAAAAPSIVLGECIPKISLKRNELVGTYVLKLADYPALAQTYKSVRIKVNGMPTSFGKILVTRLDNDVFSAVNERCPHEGAAVRDLSTSTHLYVCPLHTSRFEADGTYVDGPAGRDLTKYDTQYNGSDAISIEIPGLVAAVPSELHAISFLVHNAPVSGTVATASFGIVSAADVLLLIYDANGREVMRLTDGFREAGSYRVPYDLGALPSGVYFYRLETSTGEIRTEKFMVAR